MISEIKKTWQKHLKKHIKAYILLTLTFVIGVSAGAFSVSGLSFSQWEELRNYVTGFLNLMTNQNINTSELLKISIYENGKIILALWILGVTIIGVPFIFIVVGIRGFITGFCSGFIFSATGFKGMLFVLLALLPKEIIIVPCIISLAVNGINFSLDIIKKRSLKHISKESLKSKFMTYCFLTALYSGIIFAGVLVEVYLTPLIVKLLIPIML